ncbi:MAG TPA: hypothetical protein VGK19_08785 [Capsulimonadaceae bacterium]|jgi:hypothetical protein
MKQLIDALADYISVLADSLRTTTRSEDRLAYTKHLAQAAILFSLVQHSATHELIVELIRSEQRAYGWSCLSASEGEAAESAFVKLVKLFEEQQYRL